MVTAGRGLRAGVRAVLVVGVVALVAASAAEAGISRFEAGGTADSSYGIIPTDVSGAGRYVAFVKDGDGAVPGDTNGALDLFVRDRGTGETDGVGVNEAGELVGANGGTISDNGRVVAFTAPDGILASDTNGLQDVFVRDRGDAVTQLVSRAYDGGQANGSSSAAEISRDGRFVAFQSDASNLVPGDANGTTDVFLFDLEEATTTLVSAGRDGRSAMGTSAGPSISDDGRFVAFSSSAWNLDSSQTTFGGQVFVYDRMGGSVSVVSVDEWGSPGSYGPSFDASISGDGRIVAFSSLSSTLVPGDLNDQADIFLRDRNAGTTRRVSVPRGAATSGLESDGRSDQPQLTADGRFVTFRSDATDLVPGDGNDASDAFAVDLSTGAITRLSSTPGGSAGNGWSDRPLVAGDGRLAMFASSATDLAGDGRGGAFVVEPLQFGSPPTIEVPQDQTIEATSPDGTAISYQVTATDAEDGTVAATCTPGQGEMFPLGPVTVSCSATDSDGLTANASFVVTFVDTTAPAMQLRRINAVPVGPAGTRLGWDTHPTDNADWYPTVVCQPESFSDFVFPIGDTTVTCTATDDSGNSSSGSFLVHVLSVAELLRQEQTYLAEIGVTTTLRRSLASELEAAAKAADRHDGAGTCSAIADYQDHVRAQSGRKLTADTASTLIADADAIRRIVPCR